MSNRYLRIKSFFFTGVRQQKIEVNREQLQVIVTTREGNKYYIAINDCERAVQLFKALHEYELQQKYLNVKFDGITLVS